MKKFGTKIGQNPFLQAFFRFYQASEIDLTSIAVAYYLLISIFPLLLIVVNILPYFRIPIAEFLEAIEGVLPESLYEMIAKVIRNVLTQPSSGLLSFSILSALWAFSQSMSFLQKAFNKAYGVAKDRGIISHRLFSLVMSIGLQLLFAFSLLLTMFGRMSLRLLHSLWRFDNQLYVSLQKMTQPTIYTLLFLSLLMLYYFLPNVKIRKVRYVLPGTAFVVFIIGGLLNLFSVYLDTYVNHLMDIRFFSSVFVVVVMIWFILIAQILIVGAILNASYQSCYEKEFETRNKQLITRFIKNKQKFK
ncbi:virulence factor BrkB family protein [Streptococcus intermedius BA1]|uniref:YihY/virulence factor BrkB family protein n=1 Tax=Streptococcus intermedius TaxID=1338 RepID=UPI00029BAA8C|nr:YihY/virulence factor BrkB family protein [Streptococcus intermedius]EKU17286.1 virulence factor BrkB family protein [Streptococcus intermedius BA1]